MADMFIGLLLPRDYDEDAEIFMRGMYFNSEEALKSIHKKSDCRWSELSVVKVEKATSEDLIPVRYKLIRQVENYGFVEVWDDEGVHINTPEDIRDKAMKKIQSKNPDSDFFWEKEYLTRIV